MSLTKKDVKSEQSVKDTKFPKLCIQPQKRFFVCLESFHSSIIKKNKHTMVQELNYNVVKNVLESWEGLRRIKNYEQVAGVKLFQKYVCLFCLLPSQQTQKRSQTSFAYNLFIIIIFLI